MRPQGAQRETHLLQPPWAPKHSIPPTRDRGRPFAAEGQEWQLSKPLHQLMGGGYRTNTPRPSPGSPERGRQDGRGGGHGSSCVRTIRSSRPQRGGLSRKQPASRACTGGRSLPPQTRITGQPVTPCALGVVSDIPPPQEGPSRPSPSHTDGHSGGHASRTPPPPITFISLLTHQTRIFPTEATLTTRSLRPAEGMLRVCLLSKWLHPGLPAPADPAEDVNPCYPGLPGPALTCRPR